MQELQVIFSGISAVMFILTTIIANNVNKKLNLIDSIDKRTVVIETKMNATCDQQADHEDRIRRLEEIVLYRKQNETRKTRYVSRNTKKADTK